MYNRTKRTMLQRLFALMLIFATLIGPNTVYAASMTETDEDDTLGFVRADLDGITVSEIEDSLMITVEINDIQISLTGKAYSLSNNVNSNKIYIVESNPDPFTETGIINIEFEIGAKAENLEVFNQHLVGHDVVRVVAYIGSVIYYVEQEVTVSQLIVNSVQNVCEDDNPEVCQTIISNSTWYTHLNDAEEIIDDNSSGSVSTWVIPQLDPDLDDVDVSAISTIGKAKFTSERDVYYWDYNSNYGYYLECVEWPVDSGCILASFLFYGITKNAPSESDNTASLQFTLILNRQYRYLPNSNTIIPYNDGTDYRIYDVKLAMECTQFVDGDGYDFIYETSVLAVGGNDNTALKVAGAIIKCFDKYNIVSATESIFEAFDTATRLGTTTSYVWSSDYATHYNSFANNKRQYSMVRAVRFDTEGYILAEPNDYVLLQAKVMDRDYEDSADDVEMWKAMNYAISFELMKKDGTWIWLFGGKLKHELKTESCRYYLR